MAAQLAERRRRLGAGERSLGWKLGFGSPEALDRLDIHAPLVGFLVDGAQLAPGSGVSISRFASPLLEPEVAVHLGGDVVPGGDLTAARRAIDRIGPAFELADLDLPADDVETILRGNVFQRHVVLGPASPWSDGAAGLVGRIAGPGGSERIVADPEHATGEVIGLIRHTADLLGAFGERPRGGEVVICGSIVPPIAVVPGAEFVYRLDPISEISIRLEH